MTARPANNFTVFRPKQVTGIKFGSTDFTTDSFTSTTTALDTDFTTKNATALLDLTGARATNTSTPVIAEAFAKDITFSGNERSVTEENLLGSDTGGAQNQETVVEPASLVEVEMTIVYRNNIPLSIYNDTTVCCLMTVDNNETATAGVLNLAFRTITILKVGDISLSPEGIMEQKVKFSCKGGTTAAGISVDDGSDVWYKIYGGDYAEEIQMA